MTPNELRDLKEIAAGRSPVGNGTVTLAKVVLELLALGKTVSGFADEIREIKTQLDLHVHTPLVRTVLSDGNITTEWPAPTQEEAP